MVLGRSKTERENTMAASILKSLDLVPVVITLKSGREINMVTAEDVVNELSSDFNGIEVFFFKQEDEKDYNDIRELSPKRMKTTRKTMFSFGPTVLNGTFKRKQYV